MYKYIERITAQRAWQKAIVHKTHGYYTTAAAARSQTTQFQSQTWVHVYIVHTHQRPATNHSPTSSAAEAPSSVRCGRRRRRCCRLRSTTIYAVERCAIISHDHHRDTTCTKIRESCICVSNALNIDVGARAHCIDECTAEERVKHARAHSSMERIIVYYIV